MKSKVRGFQYELEPLISKCNWEIQDLQLEIKTLGEALTEQESRIRYLEEELTETSTTIDIQNQVIYADRQLIKHTRASALLVQLKLAQSRWQQLESEMKSTISNLYLLKKYVEGLEDHRGEAMKEHVKFLDKSAMSESDDAWLRSKHRGISA